MLAEPQLLLWGAPRWSSGRAPAFLPERRYQLLALLACAGGQPVPREQAAALLWPGRSSSDARRNLRKIVLEVRALPGVDGLEISEHALRWPIETDFQHFDSALRSGLRVQALDLRRGPALDGLDDPRNEALGQWLEQLRQRWDGAWQDAARAHLATCKDATERGTWADRLLALDPLDDSAMAERISADLAQGHEALARRRYRAFSERLLEELGAEPSARIRSLLQGPPGSRDVVNGLPAVPGMEANATSSQGREHASEAGAGPASAIDSFIGRRTEIAELQRLFARAGTRQVTIVGPGGIGKSRLAACALARSQADFPGGAWWVELQGLADLAELATRVAQQRGVQLDERQAPITQLAAALRGRPSLLVLDNAENLMGLAGWLDDLLREAGTLVVLCTSRVRLLGSNECLLELGGLAVPESDSRDLEAASSFDAVRLFEARAKAALPDFALAPHLDAVIAIAEAVDGMPLAIELAAAWVRLLPPALVAQELEASIDVLVRDPADPHALARPEHVSVRGVIARSWSLLADSEREVLACLSVCQGGIGLDAARAIAAAALPVLSSLVDKGLLNVDPTGRFSMHPLVAAHAADCLAADPPQRDAARQRHTVHFTRRIANLAPMVRSDPAAFGRAVDADFDNLRRAWLQAVSDNDAGLVSQTVGVWRSYFEQFGRRAEGLQQLRKALAMTLPAADLAAMRALARTQQALARLGFLLGDDRVGALTLAETGADLATVCHDRRTLVACLLVVGAGLAVQKRFEAAEPAFERALAIAREDGERAEVVSALNSLGVMHRDAGDFRATLRCSGEALAIARELGHPGEQVRVLRTIAGAHMELDEWAQACARLREAEGVVRDAGLTGPLHEIEQSLGFALIDLGELDEAERRLNAVRRRYKELGEGAEYDVPATYNLARIASRRGDWAQALRLLDDAARRPRKACHWADLAHVALFYGEHLKGLGRRIEAARIWQAVQAEARGGPGVRDSAQRWQAELKLTARERSALRTPSLGLEAVIAQLHAEVTALGTSSGSPGASLRAAAKR